MKTVPTVCATATVVGVSAVGLSLGRPDHPSTALRKPFTSDRLDDSQMTSACYPPPSSSKPLPFSSPLQPSQHIQSSSLPPPTRQSYDGRFLSRRIRGITSRDSSIDRRGSVSYSSTPVQEEFDTAFALRPRSSWVKRLSILSSYDSSYNNSPRPESPSVSCSNGSMAFSHDGSTAPIVFKGDPSPLPPNKLVKRSSSMRAPNGSSFQSSRLPTLRRPATSHQRSATLQNRTSIIEMPLEESPPIGAPLSPIPNGQEGPYTQYFTVKTSNDNLRSKRRSPAPDTRRIKLVSPDRSHPPTLLLAQSVSRTTSPEAEDSESQDEDDLSLDSRPGTPSDGLHSSEPALMTNEHPAAQPLPEESKPRQSFSLSGLLPGSAHSWKQHVLRPAPAKLARKLSKRRTSAPALTKTDGPPILTEAERRTKHRDITDPLLRQEAKHLPCDQSDNPPVTDDSFPDHLLVPDPEIASRPTSRPTSQVLHHDPARSSTGNSTQDPPSPTLVQASGRPSRHSVAPSEHASTLVGSDNETRGIGSGDDDDTDMQSETVFDSLRSGATRSTSGAHGPRIDTIFDESPPSTLPKGKGAILRDLLPRGSFPESPTEFRQKQIIKEEEESLSTPVRSTVTGKDENNSPVTLRGSSRLLFTEHIPSSPPEMPQPLNLGTLEWDTVAEEDDRWTFDEEEEDDDVVPNFRNASTQHVATPLSVKRTSARLLVSHSSDGHRRKFYHFHDKDARASIFDWSEQQPDKSPGSNTPPRPRTVHGKKDGEVRGSRPVGRRAPSALHARSQSVPVVPDVSGKRSTVITNKFGTWGVGSKGVTEDWDDDFDFEDPNHSQTSIPDGEEQRVDSGLSMVVPKNIQEQQSNVLANIGLLREWGVLIEELKELRMRATTLGIIECIHGAVWDEVDAMIDLADQEADDETPPARLTPPSSPGFDMDAFDELVMVTPSPDRNRRRSGLISKHGSPSGLPTFPPHGNKSRRKSILTSNDDIFAPRSSPIPYKTKPTPTTTPSKDVPVMRPRKDSEAVARSVIEALQKRKSMSEPVSGLQPASSTSKIPFDTATLRRIVPYVNSLMRKVKESMRDAEGLYSSPDPSPKEPPFSQIYLKQRGES